MKRYLMVVGIILAVLIGLGLWLKPPPEKMRESVEMGLSEYAKQHLKPGDTMPGVTHSESHDWLIAVSHEAKVGDLSFFCVGGFKVTFCSLPDE